MIRHKNKKFKHQIQFKIQSFFSKLFYYETSDEILYKCSNVQWSQDIYRISYIYFNNFVYTDL